MPPQLSSQSSWEAGALRRQGHLNSWHRKKKRKKKKRRKKKRKKDNKVVR